MMQLRKICNHPYLIEGAEENIQKDKEEDPLQTLIKSSSKFVFMDKLLDRLRSNKNRVFLFHYSIDFSGLDLLSDDSIT
jgi:SNF2 family DNA or RNA helicase